MFKEIFSKKVSSARSLFIATLLLGLMGIAGCGGLPERMAFRNMAAPVATDEGLDGKILVWHAFTGAEAEALEAIFTSFAALNPNLDLLVTRVDRATMPGRFIDAAHSGLGPDLFIGPNEWIVGLAANDLILPVEEVLQQTQSVDVDSEPADAVAERVLERYTSTVLRTVTYDDQVYALPGSLNVQALYYNRALLPEGTELPETLDELLQQASRGNSVAIGTTFTDAFWGVPAFGGRLFDEDGNVMLNEGGFANWLNWLTTAREIPGTLLDPNREELRNRFRAGSVAYYVGYADEYNQIVQSSSAESGAASTSDAAQGEAAPTDSPALSPQDIGVTLLPDGPAGNAGPLLFGESYFFNSASAPRQLRLALSIVDFATNAENSTALMREAALVPANISVRVNARLDPNMASFVSQTRSAVPYPNVPSNAEWVRQGTTVYRQVMQGILSPAQAADELTQALVDVPGFAASDAPPSECMDVGVVTLWDSANAAVSSALDSTIQAFTKVCPTIIVRRVPVSEEALRTEWITATVGAGSRVDLLLAPHDTVGEFAEAEALHEISSAVGVEVLQRYAPVALDAMRYNDRLYGLPYYMDVPILYYNRQLVDAPVSTLDELLDFANAAAPAAIPLTFERAAWGVSAFGGSQPGEAAPAAENGAAEPIPGRFVVGVGAWVDWLTWLRTASDNPGIWLTPDPLAARERFASGDASYYIGPSRELRTLQDDMGADQVGVAALPTGTDTNFRVLLQSHGFVFNASTSDAQMARALQFALFATGTDSQRTLVEKTLRTPANVTVSLDAGDPVNAFIDRATFADVAPRSEQMAVLSDAFDRAYERFLEDDLTPWAAMRHAVQTLVSQQNEGVTLDELLQRDSITLEQPQITVVDLGALGEEAPTEDSDD